MKAIITSSLWIVWPVHHSLYGAVSQGMDPLSDADYLNIHPWTPHEILCPSWKPLRSHPKKALPRGLVQALRSWPSLLSPHSKEFQWPNMARILNSLKQHSAPSMERMAQQNTGTISSFAFLQDWWGCACPPQLPSLPSIWWQHAASSSHYASFKEELMCTSPFLYKPIKIPMQMTGFIIWASLRNTVSCSPQ